MRLKEFSGIWLGAKLKVTEEIAKNLTRPYAVPPGWQADDSAIVARHAARIGLCSRIQRVASPTIGDPRTPGMDPNFMEITETYTCKDRLCPICSRKRGNKHRATIRSWGLSPTIDPKGATNATNIRMDGNGKVADDRSDEEITDRMTAIALKYAQMAGDDDESQAQAAEKIARALKKEENALASSRRTKKLYWYLLTLTIPNIPHLFTRDEDGQPVNHLDEKLWQPWTKLWRASRAANARAKRRYDKGKAPRRRKKRFPGLNAIRSIQGYFAAGEITRNAQRNDFHPHIHMLVASKNRTMSKKQILAAWQHATGDKAVKIIDVRPADPMSIGHELVKYLSKAGDAHPEIVRATHKKRQIRTGGAFFGIRRSRWEADAQKEARTREPRAEKGEHYRRTWAGDHWEYRPLIGQMPYSPLRTPEEAANPTRMDPETGELVPMTLLAWREKRRAKPPADIPRALIWPRLLELSPKILKSGKEDIPQ